MSHGLLLINLGTPNNNKKKDIARYLHQFLMDKRVINLPWLFRFTLVYGLIVPFRAKKTTHAYTQIWTEKGSPLLEESQKLTLALQKELGSQVKVVLGMRYGNPSIDAALAELKNCSNITILPLYPQYASATTGSSLEEIFRLLSSYTVLPSLHIIREFYAHPSYIKAQAQIIRDQYQEHHHLLFSYHGLPEHQIRQSGCASVCKESCPEVSDTNQACYRAQCYQTSNSLAKELNLEAGQFSTAFQSRLGKTPWIKPYTDELLLLLRQRGITHLTVVSPSFICDCLETLEELGVRGQQQWLELGGTQFKLIPCLNDNPIWVDAVLKIIPKQ